MITKVLKKLDYLIDRASHILLLLSGFVVLLMAWVVSYGVLKRYAFRAPDPYTYEISTMFLLFCGVLAVAAVHVGKISCRAVSLLSQALRNEKD